MGEREKLQNFLIPLIPIGSEDSQIIKKVSLPLVDIGIKLEKDFNSIEIKNLKNSIQTIIFGPLQ